MSWNDVRLLRIVKTAGWRWRERQECFPTVAYLTQVRKRRSSLRITFLSFSIHYRIVKTPRTLVTPPCRVFLWASHIIVNITWWLCGNIIGCLLSFVVLALRSLPLAGLVCQWTDSGFTVFFFYRFGVSCHDIFISLVNSVLCTKWRTRSWFSSSNPTS